MALNILAVVPVRGGSKGLKGKNILPLHGLPLVTYSIRALLGAREQFYKIIASTDDEKIAKVCEAAGCEVPFLRPKELAEDTTPSVDVMKHAVTEIEKKEGVKIDWTLLVQATNPLVISEDVKAALKLISPECDSIVSVYQANHYHPLRMMKIEGGRLVRFLSEEKEPTRRQDLPSDAYRRNGSLYLTRRDVLFEKNSMFGDKLVPYVMPLERSIDIDNELDFQIAELMLERNERKRLATSTGFNVGLPSSFNEPG